MSSMLKILEYIGDKIFDQIINGSIDALMQEETN